MILGWLAWGAALASGRPLAPAGPRRDRAAWPTPRRSAPSGWAGSRRAPCPGSRAKLSPWTRFAAGGSRCGSSCSGSSWRWGSTSRGRPGTSSRRGSSSAAIHLYQATLSPLLGKTRGPLPLPADVQPLRRGGDPQVRRLDGELEGVLANPPLRSLDAGRHGRSSLESAWRICHSEISPSDLGPIGISRHRGRFADMILRRIWRSRQRPEILGRIPGFCGGILADMGVLRRLEILPEIPRSCGVSRVCAICRGVPRLTNPWPRDHAPLDGG